MAPAVELFAMAGLTSVTGSLYFLCWLAVKPILDRLGLVATALRLLYVALALFTVPVLYWLILWMSQNGSHAVEGAFPLSTPSILQWTQRAGWIWAAGMALLFLYHLYGIYEGGRLLRYSRPCKQQVERRLEICRTQLGFSDPVQVRWSRHLRQPMVQGCFRCTICLPDPRSYTEGELDLILLHELIHCRRHDVLMKHLLALIRCIHWWNPFAYLLVREAGRWIEARCDQEVWRNVSETQMPLYYRLLIQVSVQPHLPADLTAGFWERKSYLKTRILRMERNRRRKRRGETGGPLAAAGVILLLGLLTASAALAAGEVTRAGYDVLFERTAVVQVEEPAVPLQEETWSKVETNPAIQVEEVPIAEREDGSGPFSIQWQVAEGIQRQSTAVFLEAGSTFSLQVSGTDRGISFQAGLITPDGMKRFVQGEENLIHSFSLSQTGSYRIFVENTGEAELQVTGVYEEQKQ